MISLKKFNKDENVNLLLRGIALSSLTTLSNKNKSIMKHKMNDRLKNKSVYYFILNDKIIIGTICLLNENEIYINDFAIFEEFQNNDFGTEVLNYIKNKYKNKNFELGVEKRNLKALHLYQKIGFKIFKEFNEGYFLRLEKG